VVIAVLLDKFFEAARRIRDKNFIAQARLSARTRVRTHHLTNRRTPGHVTSHCHATGHDHATGYVTSHDHITGRVTRRTP
jgi:hypothetical protein